ncbi:hypothetical protein TSUD_94140 [Trifolium subterraneum]|uniref:Uncharacterized protein n=1 Tax=Trifolium subterraneum TaxID=3900 RepID=A0A2Z6NIC1_TRISU|nr:hypothetical protein TSUD_94140 [Trifolium subterraneum]
MRMRQDEPLEVAPFEIDMPYDVHDDEQLEEEENEGRDLIELVGKGNKLFKLVVLDQPPFRGHQRGEGRVLMRSACPVLLNFCGKKANKHEINAEVDGSNGATRYDLDVL